MPRRQLKHKSHSRAFSVCGSDDSNRMRVYTRDGESFTGVRDSLLFLESAIHRLAESGKRDGLRRALKEYALTVIRLKRGVEW